MFDCKNIASEKADGDTTPAGANTNRVACRDFEKQLADAAERNAGGGFWERLALWLMRKVRYHPD